MNLLEKGTSFFVLRIQFENRLRLACSFVEFLRLSRLLTFKQQLRDLIPLSFFSGFFNPLEEIGGIGIPGIDGYDFLGQAPRFLEVVAA